MKLSIGDSAPLFKGKDQDGKIQDLSAFLGNKIVLYFYPKDDTPGCTAQACNLRDNYSSFKAQGYDIFGISGDTEASHKKFQKKYNLPFTLIADPEKLINELYGVWVEKSMYGRTYMGTARTTFVIDEKGKISNIINKVETSNHTNQLLASSVNKTASLKKTPVKKSAISSKKAVAPKKSLSKTKSTVKKIVVTKSKAIPKKKDSLVEKKITVKKKPLVSKATTPKKSSTPKKKT